MDVKIVVLIEFTLSFITFIIDYCVEEFLESLASYKMSENNEKYRKDGVQNPKIGLFKFTVLCDKLKQQILTGSSERF